MVDSDDGDDMDSEDLVKITAEVVDFRRPYVDLRRSSRCTHCSYL